MKRYLLIIAILIIAFTSYSQGLGPVPGSQKTGTSLIVGGFEVDSMMKLPFVPLTKWQFVNNFMSYIGLLAVNRADTLPYYIKDVSHIYRLLTTNDPVGTGTVTNVATSYPISGGPITTTGTISIPKATTHVSGYLDSVDWKNFNAKGSGTVTSVSGTSGRISSTGSTTPVIDLATANPTPATYGGSSAIPVITVDGYGRATIITTAAPATSGTVTSIGLVVPAAYSVSPTTITSSGVFTISPTGTSAQYVKGDGSLGTTPSGTITSVSGTVGRISSTGGATPVIDMVTANATPATYGSSSTIPVITIDAYGRATTITTASAATGTVTSVSGTVGRITSTGGATPVIDMATANATPAVYGGSSAIPVITVDAYGRATTITTASPATSGTVTSIGMSISSAFSVTPTTITSSGVFTITGTGTTAQYIRGDGTLATTPTGTVISVSGTAGRITSTGGATPVIDMATANATPATYGSSTIVPVITVDAYGRATTITTASISAGSGTVTSVASGDGVVVTGTASVNPTVSIAAVTTYTITEAHAFTVTATNSHAQVVTLNHSNTTDTVTLAGFTTTAAGGCGKINAITIKFKQDATGGTGVYLTGTNFVLPYATSRLVPTGTTASTLCLILYCYYDDNLAKIVVDYGSDYQTPP